MIREEAIKRVKGYLTDYISADCYGEVEEIMEALEQQPYEDCISRSGALSVFRPRGITEDVWKECDVYKKLTALPSVEPKKKTEWIPVSERLPENNGTYLVWDKYGYQISDFNAEEQTFGFLNECNFDYETGEVYPPCWVEHDTVIAWMPLPAPFEPQGTRDKE